jgi:dipeptidase E
VLFVPYARPGGSSEEQYFTNIRDRLKKMGIILTCASSQGITDPNLDEVEGIMIGGGHTYTLLEKLQKTGSLEIIRKRVNQGLPYMGSSAGTIITCPTIKTTNDMPGAKNDVIDLKSLGFLNFQLNCHYMDDRMHDPLHQGETRDTRLREFCAFNPDHSVLGLYEGQALKVTGERIELLTSARARGTRTPVFKNDQRTELVCEIGKSREIKIEKNRIV